MGEASVSGLFIGAEEGGSIESRSEIVAVAGRGVEGDRYYQPDNGSLHDDTLEITLFEAEAVEEGNEKAGLGLEPADMRRNVMTSGVHLRDLIGRKFRVGEVTLEGLEDNPPCRHLEELAGKPLLKPLVERGGIRARIVESGTIRIGDAISTG